MFLGGKRMHKHPLLTDYDILQRIFGGNDLNAGILLFVYAVAYESMMAIYIK